ncbi:MULTISPECIES: DUF2249 domain-containing protein [Azospirillum]|uniref:DUF2249 domain-containing protein n=1 Tax=Azospirillum brasilense TaxID=192 RepID=A0ABU4PHJ2_AZOBR|nr:MULTISPECIES: DUF2249 domain-containing protein [Azospirillum]ALJ39460.1 hypothetical protein AMK58_28630 [Azospirillum brasilense]MDX5955919.1 DUF2249 domain-containing protein [Azospirillum brasilense]PWC81961.1 hypothetical protein AEJ54_32060 [Azospirillum sp. Sp 7]
MPPSDCVTLDLRDLQPPEPLLRILERIDSGNGEPFDVRLKRDPLLLYPELAERGWTWERLDAETEEKRLRLFPLSND